jgi:hypothetical protein
VTVIDRPLPPVEGWMRLRDGWRSRLRAFGAGHPQWGDRVIRVRSWLLWGAVALLAVLALTLPRYRHSLGVYLCCYWILILWFAVARTKTVTWSAAARLFSLSVAWSWVIAWVSYRLTGWSGLRVSDVGPGTAIAAFTEESLKLVPLVLIAVVAPGRVRRFAAVDWLLLGLVSGLGFQAWEDLMRRLTRSVLTPGIFDLLTGQGPGSGFPQYGWGLLSGASSGGVGDGSYAYAGHHILTGLIGGCVGLGIAAWRQSSAGSSSSRAAIGWRGFAVGLPLLAWFLAVADHFGNNATPRNLAWLDGDKTAVPWPLRFAWAHLGRGAGMGQALLVVLVACLLVDARRLQQAGPVSDLPAVPADSLSWIDRPRELVGRWQAAVPAHRGRAMVDGVLALVGFAGRDLVVLLAAHARQGDESRRAAMSRGRAASVMLRQIRAAAQSAELDQADAQRELRSRRRFRLIAVGVLAVVLFAGIVLAALLARHLGTDLTPHGGPLSWLAGQFDALAHWWDGRSLGEKIFIGLGIAALIALSGGSLTLAMGVSGAATYLAEHGEGAADLLRDPGAATRSWWNTTTPAGMVLDLAEFGLTFAPGDLVGALAGRQLRELGVRGADMFGDWRYFRGGWEGPNGLRLSSDEFRAAQQALGRSAAAEPAITARMVAVTDDLPSGELVGLDYRLKGTDSLARKVATAFDEGEYRDVARALGDINDDVRYTIQMSAGNYTNEVTQAVRSLQDSGYQVFKWKNTWTSPGYKGINSFWRDPATGQTFEVQFHTPQSFDAKMVTHDLYEQSRVPGVDQAARNALDAQQNAIFGAVPQPPGASGLDLSGLTP